MTKPAISSILAKELLQIKAIKLSPQNPFIWASGMLSPIYCDNRISLSYPSIRKIVLQGFVELSKSFDDFDVVAGVATAGIPHGALLAEALDKPFVYVRAKAKAHGRKNMIEGYLKGDEKILVVEDLISTGGSSLLAVDALQQKGCKVVGVVAIFTYGFDLAVENFAKAKCPIKTITNYDILIQEAIKMEYISKNQRQVLQDWKNEPAKWAKSFEHS
ncbi:MAG TPA: orotate phosphoribosyltransferase [Phaeodactylibacter sp.]|nr:orotate phosphoribosyltransferase [Phaeodactylibacter sp.]